jgi:hypothetical protein
MDKFKFCLLACHQLTVEPVPDISAVAAYFRLIFGPLFSALPGSHHRSRHWQCGAIEWAIVIQRANSGYTLLLVLKSNLRQYDTTGRGVRDLKRVQRERPTDEQYCQNIQLVLKMTMYSMTSATRVSRKIVSSAEFKISLFTV